MNNYTVCLEDSFNLAVKNIVNINVNIDTNIISFFDSFEESALPVLMIPLNKFIFIEKDTS